MHRRPAGRRSRRWCRAARWPGSGRGCRRTGPRVHLAHDQDPALAVDDHGPRGGGAVERPEAVRRDERGVEPPIRGDARHHHARVAGASDEDLVVGQDEPSTVSSPPVSISALPLLPNSGSVVAPFAPTRQEGDVRRLRDLVPADGDDLAVHLVPYRGRLGLGARAAPDPRRQQGAAGEVGISAPALVKRAIFIDEPPTPPMPQPVATIRSPTTSISVK